MGNFFSNSGKDKSSVVPIAILRFIVFIPFGIYESFARNHWRVIKDHVQLQGGVYSPLIARGERIAARWGKFGLFWNFAVWLPALIIPEPFSLGFGIIDLAVAVELSMATALQTKYSPHDVDRCKGSPGTHNWQRPPGANESFFDAAARLNATSTDSFHMCKSFVQEWQYGIAISVFFSLIAVLNILFCSATCIRSARDARRHNRSYRKELLGHLSNLPKIAIIFFLTWVWYLPIVLFRCLPLCVKSRARFATQYTFKAGQEVENKVEMRMKQLIRRDGTMRYQGADAGKPACLAEFLSIYDILILVVEELHYVDIQNLSLTSKSVREAILPASDYARRSLHFRLYTCEKRSKKQCWLCTNQICDSCKQRPQLKQTALCFHLDLCRPYCSTCYFKTVQDKVRILRLGPPMCCCAPPTNTPNWFQRYWKPKDFYKKWTWKYVPRSVCRQCNLLDADEILEKRKMRSKLELKDREGRRRKDMDKCRGCQVRLRGGPRWWVCEKCKKECRSSVHAAWGKKEKKEGVDVMVEMV